MYKYKVTFFDRMDKVVRASRVVPDKGFFMFYTYEPGAIFQSAKLVASFPMADVKAVECVEGEAHD